MKSGYILTAMIASAVIWFGMFHYGMRSIDVEFDGGVEQCHDYAIDNNVITQRSGMGE